MSLYHPSFNYLGKNSKDDFGIIVSHLDNSDSGETETFLQMDPVYTDNYLGTRRIDYGAKYSSVAVFNITLIKQSGGDFSTAEIRECLKWLTGAQSNSNLELILDGEVKYFFTGRFTNVSQYKMDARTIGLVLEFTSIAPWAYSAPQPVTQTLTGTETLTINCETDDLYSYVYMRTTYTNTTGKSVIIKNTTIGDITEIFSLAVNEIVTLDNNMTITSDKTTRIFGNDFNFVFPRLQAGENVFEITGTGNIQFEYIIPVKLGNVAIDINTYSDPICDDSGVITIEKLPWSRLTDIPTTLSEHNIQDAYTKTQIDEKIANVTVGNVYTKSEIDDMLDNLNVDVDLSNYYTKTEVNALLSSAEVKIDDAELNAMLAEVLI